MMPKIFKLIIAYKSHLSQCDANLLMEWCKGGWFGCQEIWVQFQLDLVILVTL